MGFRNNLVIFSSFALLGFSSSGFSVAPGYYDSSEIYKERPADFRNYYRSVSDEEIKDMRFILKALAQKSLVSLWGYKGELEEAGDRIEHIHPLRFLECIFTDDELIVYIQNIKSRGGWVWSEFASGFKKSFQEEADRGNLLEEYLIDFMSKIKLDLNLVYKKFRKQDWEDFIKILITNAQRNGDPSKHDQ